MATRIRPDGTELNRCRNGCDHRKEHAFNKRNHCLARGVRLISLAVDSGAQLFPTWCPLPRGGRSLVTSKEKK